ncbi:MAG TPA: glycosyltransferase family 39 protein, partial [Terrimicrobiaceae bacterium]|nr:glycosyltransferase family 39 protein [Terrimicrobiaceae bacterium]
MKNRTRVLKEKFHSLGPPAKTRLVLAAIGGLLLACLLATKKPWTIDLPSSGPWKLSHYVAVYVWIGLLINLIVTTLLAFTASWWTRPLAERPFRRSSPPRWFWPLVAVAMAVNAWICWPRLWQSFWHDENYPLRNAIVGVYRQRPDDSLSLKPVSWEATFFFTRSRIIPSTVAWRVPATSFGVGPARPKGLPFSEPVIRLPAYLAGIASIATIALLLQELEFPLAGVLAAFLSALHPWHIRYASEARAYAFVLCLIPLVLYSFLRALKDGRWRWWVAFSACAFLLMYSYPTCIYVLIVLNLCALPAIWWQREKT